MTSARLIAELWQLVPTGLTDRQPDRRPPGSVEDPVDQPVDHPVDQLPTTPESRWVRSGPGLTPEQLRELYAEHGQALYDQAWRACRDPGLAEDVVQETLLRAWQRAPLLDPGRASLRGWLLVVGRHILIDALRARAARPKEIATDSPPEKIGPGDVEDHAVQSRQMASALALLSHAHREVLVQLYYLDRTVTQAAAILNVPEGTIKSRAYYALRALRVALADLGVTHERRS